MSTLSKDKRTSYYRFRSWNNSDFFPTAPYIPGAHFFHKMISRARALYFRRLGLEISENRGGPLGLDKGVLVHTLREAAHVSQAKHKSAILLAPQVGGIQRKITALKLYYEVSGICDLIIFIIHIIKC